MYNPYDQIAHQYHAPPYEFRQRKYVDLLLRGLPPKASIIDLGCGTGRPVAEYLIGLGHNVVGVDSSAKMLEIAAQVVPAAELIYGDILEVEIEGQFAAAVMWDSLFHIERSLHSAVFGKINRLLPVGGKVLLSAGGLGGENFTSEMYGVAFFYSGHAPEKTQELIEAEGFEVELREVDDPSSRGHIAVLARKV